MLHCCFIIEMMLLIHPPFLSLSLSYKKYDNKCDAMGKKKQKKKKTDSEHKIAVAGAGRNEYNVQ